jgi:hypothetical protein
LLEAVKALFKFLEAFELGMLTGFSLFPEMIDF